MHEQRADDLDMERHGGKGWRVEVLRVGGARGNEVGEESEGTDICVGLLAGCDGARWSDVAGLTQLLVQIYVAVIAPLCRHWDGRAVACSWATYSRSVIRHCRFTNCTKSYKGGGMEG